MSKPKAKTFSRIMYLTVEQYPDVGGSPDSREYVISNYERGSAKPIPKRPVWLDMCGAMAETFGFSKKHFDMKDTRERYPSSKGLRKIRITIEYL